MPNPIAMRTTPTAINPNFSSELSGLPSSMLLNRPLVNPIKNEASPDAITNAAATTEPNLHQVAYPHAGA